MVAASAPKTPLPAADGLPPVAWGNVPLAPMSTMPLGSFTPPAAAPAPAGDAGKAAPVVSRGIHKDAEDGTHGTREWRDGLRETVWQGAVAKLNRIEPKFIAALTDFWSGQRRLILRNLGKGVLEADAILPQVDEQTTRLVEAVGDYMREPFMAGAIDALEQVGGTVEQGKGAAAGAVAKFSVNPDAVNEWNGRFGENTDG